MQPVAVEYISTETINSGLHNHCFGGNRFIHDSSSWYKRAIFLVQCHRIAQETFKGVNNQRVRIAQWEAIKYKVLDLCLHMSWSTNIASALLMENYNVLSAASTVRWCDAWVPIQCISLQSALWDHLAFQKELLPSANGENVLQKSFNFHLAKGDWKYMGLKNKQPEQKLTLGYSHS